jgi:hypothetical protein
MARRVTALREKADWDRVRTVIVQMIGSARTERV